MYHIANDLRAKKSAELICQGLEECLKEMPLNKIHIVNIYKKCFVSRATFYRLFDTIEDVFAYECDLIREDTMKAVKTAKPTPSMPSHAASPSRDGASTPRH